MILPPYQKRGFGSSLYEAFHDMLLDEYADINEFTGTFCVAFYVVI